MIDLHIHSDFSADGNDPPEKMIRRAKERGLSAVSLTEHQTVESYERGSKEAEKLGLEYISGIEVGGMLQTGNEFVEVHVLGYFFPVDSPEIRNLVEIFEVKRLKYLGILFEGLEVLNVPITPELVREEYPDRKPSVVYIRRIMRERGYAKDKPESSALEAKAIAAAGYPDLKPGIEPGEVVEKLRSGGAMVYMAHPFWLTQPSRGSYPEEDIWRHVDAMMKLGIDGIEVINKAGETGEYSRQLLDLCMKHNMPACGGTDSHRAEDVGSLIIPDEFLISMIRHREGRDPWV